jgi:ketosteroid isomerase-like protein
VSDNCRTVGAIYEAFGRGDVATILGHVAEDVEWEYAWSDSPIPWLAPGRGRDHVARFFGVVAGQLAFERFEVSHLLGSDGVVVALASLDAVVRATGKHIVETDEAHIWYFDEVGRVRRFRHAADTYQHFQALQPG